MTLTNTQERTQVQARPILFQVAMSRSILRGIKTQTRRTINPNHIPDVPLDHIEILAPNGRVSSRRPPGHPDVAEAARTQGYTTRTVEQGLIERGERRFGKPGEVLWVREAWQLMTCMICGDYGDREECEDEIGGPIPRTPAPHYAARYATEGDEGPYRPGVHMPRWAARTLLTVKKVRVERVRDISRADAIAEGAEEQVVQDAPFGPRAMWSMDWADKPAVSYEYGLSSPQTAFWNYLERLHGGPRWNLKHPQLYELNPLLYVVEFEVQP